MTLCQDNTITCHDIQLRPGPGPGVGDIDDADDSAPGGLGDQLEDVEREAIVKALEQTRYNKTAAARVLGITFRALRYRIKKLGIE
jgi:two-component system response regulator PilR (NtrC family)